MFHTFIKQKLWASKTVDRKSFVVVVAAVCFFLWLVGWLFFLGGGGGGELVGWIFLDDFFFLVIFLLFSFVCLFGWFWFGWLVGCFLDDTFFLLFSHISLLNPVLSSRLDCSVSLKFFSAFQRVMT